MTNEIAYSNERTIRAMRARDVLDLAAKIAPGLIANPNGAGGMHEECASQALDHAEALMKEWERRYLENEAV